MLQTQLSEEIDTPDRRRSPTTSLWLALVLTAYLCGRLLEIAQTPIPRTAIVALDVLSAAAFALVHGARRYRFGDVLVFSAICLVVGNAVENIGVATGFPFGRYYFLNLMGPKLLHVPVLLGLAYVGMAYVSFVLADLILGAGPAPIASRRVVSLAILASLIMTSWDLAQDPIWSTVLHGWVWRDGGVWFGVPVSNYLGWCGTNFLMCLLFALYLRGRKTLPSGALARWPVLFYATCAAANVMQLLPRANSTAVTDPSGRFWRVADITRASAFVSIFVMGTFVALAWVKLSRVGAAAKD